MSRWPVVVMGLLVFASCNRAQEERLAELEAELAEMRQAIEAQQVADRALQGVLDRDPPVQSDPQPLPTEGAHDHFAAAAPAEAPQPHAHADRPRHADHGDSPVAAAHRTEAGHERQQSAGHHTAGHDAPGHDGHQAADHKEQRPAGHAARAAASDVRPTGSVIGVIQSFPSARGGVRVEVLAPGEEAARVYWASERGQREAVAAVRKAKVGDTVEIEWRQTNHGPEIQSFEVLD